MRAVPGKDHPSLYEPAQAVALEGVDRHPVQSEIIMPHHPGDAGDHAVRLAFMVGVSVPAKLQVDAIDVVGLLVQQG